MNRARSSDEAFRRAGYRSVYARAPAPPAPPGPERERRSRARDALGVAAGLAGAVLPIAAAAAYARYAAPPGQPVPTWIEDELVPATGRPLLGMREFLSGEPYDDDAFF